MAQPEERIVLDRVLAAAERDITAALTEIAQRIAGILTTSASADGSLNPANEEALQEQVGDLVQRFFTVNRDNRGQVGRSAYNGVTALSRFAEILNTRYVQIVAEQVAIQYRWMRDNVPDDVFRFLSTVQTVPLSTVQEIEVDPRLLRAADETLEDYLARMARLRIFQVNPLSQIEPSRRWVPMHRWNDPNGYRLSDRIWQSGVRTRLKIDAILAESIRTGRGSLETAKLLERFLRPDRANIRTNKPYGTNASYDAMRLARTEIARASNHAAYIAAYMNPYVDRIDVRRSANGDPTCKVCPQHATIGISGERIREPYRLGDGLVPIYHPHCVTPGQKVRTLRGDIPIEEVVKGDYVLTHEDRYSLVTDAWSRQYTGWVHKIKCDEGDFELTSEHPVLTSQGWRDAQFIKSGDQVIHAISNTVSDFPFGISEGQPTKSTEFFISNSISGWIVPVFAIAFDSHTTFNQSKINTVIPDLVFSAVLDSASIKFFQHHKFDRIRVSSFLGIQTVSSRKNAGVDMLFDMRDFLTDIWPFSGIIIARHIPGVVHFSKQFTGSSRPSAIIAFPLEGDPFTSTTHFDTEIIADCFESAILQPQLLTDFFGCHFTNDIHSVNDIICQFPKLFFNALNMNFCSSNAVTKSTMFSVAELTTTGTCLLLRHDNNLLSLSVPDDVVGTESGNPVVRQVANPSQALLNYTIVNEVETRWYDGLVYNMSVDTDETYTVNGFVVHNCKCAVLPVPADSPQAVTERIRAVMQDGELMNIPVATTPAQMQGFIQALIGAELMVLLMQTVDFSELI